MGKNVTARPGRYRISFTPYQKEPQESFTDPEVQTTVLYWAKRLGKTEMINNLHGSVIEQDPKNILVVYPVIESAKKWSKQFFNPMVKSVSELAMRLRETGRRESSNTILAKEYPGGIISAIGANSASGFRQVQAPVVTCDEIDAMEDGPEGDPVELAFGRAENYSDNVQVVSSTATRIHLLHDDEDGQDLGSGSRIHDWWLKSDQRKWFVPCGCGVWHVMEWKNVKWPPIHQHERAWYETPCCGAKWTDAERVIAVQLGEWRPTANFSGVRGYWLNGLNTTFPAKKGFKSKLHQMAADFYRAEKGGEAKRVYWMNTFLCEPFEVQGERIEPSLLIERLEDYAPTSLPDDVIMTMASCDVQKDRIECEVVGLGEDDETWGIEFKKFFGDTEQDDVWTDLAEHLSRKYQRRDGTELPISATTIDMRHKPHKVRKFVHRSGIPRVFPVYGAGSHTPILVTTRFNKHYRLRSFAINTKLAKDILFSRLRIGGDGENGGPRFMHFPKGHGYSDDYFLQLTAEVLRRKKERGIVIERYEKIRERNEALDIRVYFLALIDILKPNITAISKKLTRREYVLNPDEPHRPEQPPPIKPPPMPRKPFVRPRMGGGFVGGWRK